MSLGYSAVALPGLTDPKSMYFLDKDQSSWFVSIATISTPIGCFLSGPISDKFGRKVSLLTVNVVTFIGWVIITLAPNFPNSFYSVLLIGRVITGLSTGLASMPAAVYMAEISSPKLRGMFTTASAIFFSLGILVVYFLGFLMPSNWSKISLITSIFPVISMTITTFFLPESPQWLIAKNMDLEAKKNLTKIFGLGETTGLVQDEILALIGNRDQNLARNPNNKKSSFLRSVLKKIRHFQKPACYKPFVIVLSYFFFLQFSGTFVIIFYAIDIVKEAGVISTDPYLIIVLIASTRLAGAILISSISKKLGHRPPSIISGVGMTLCMITLFIYLYLIHLGIIGDDLKTKLSWLPIFLLVFYFFTTTLGFLTVPFAMAAEVFPTKIRGLATGLVTCLAYGFNFIILKSYPTMLKSMGNYGVFCFYGVMSFIGTIFIITCLPETKGKTLSEIEEYFSGRRGSNRIDKS
nr:facilitated trehalose transporter Tret1-like isoform X2 [Onthophagus taurus]XP_022907728.1 facilitated trehalose transporter Tret1-like isoform X2 [Onthophagus taurus]XP_022912396.1 facilitated trehalose transporter Tret1-like [Onthophagus taurus]